MSPTSDNRHKRNYVRRVSRLPRWSHRAWAFLFGYFWLPCPTCGEPFGGHEWRDIDGKSSSISAVGFEQIGDLYHTTTKRKGICPACTRDGVGQPEVVVTLKWNGDSEALAAALKRARFPR